MPKQKRILTSDMRRKKHRSAGKMINAIRILNSARGALQEAAYHMAAEYRLLRRFKAERETLRILEAFNGNSFFTQSGQDIMDLLSDFNNLPEDEL